MPNVKNSITNAVVRLRDWYDETSENAFDGVSDNKYVRWFLLLVAIPIVLTLIPLLVLPMCTAVIASHTDMGSTNLGQAVIIVVALLWISLMLYWGYHVFHWL